MTTERRYLHPHDSSVTVVDILDADGRTVDSYNVASVSEVREIFVAGRSCAPA